MPSKNDSPCKEFDRAEALRAFREPRSGNCIKEKAYRKNALRIALRKFSIESRFLRNCLGKFFYRKFP